MTAFQARLGEAFDEALLRKAFISPCFVDHQRKLYQDQMGEDLIAPNFEANDELAVEGKNIIDETLKTYLRTSLPHLPEEGVEAITKFLTKEELLAHVSFHIGTLDLVQSVVSFHAQSLFGTGHTVLPGAGKGVFRMKFLQTASTAKGHVLVSF